MCGRSVCFIYSFPGFENRWLCVCRAEVCVNCLAGCWWRPSNHNNGVGGACEQPRSSPFHMTRKQTACSRHTRSRWQPAGLRPVPQTRDAGQTCTRDGPEASEAAVHRRCAERPSTFRNIPHVASHKVHHRWKTRTVTRFFLTCLTADLHLLRLGQL